MCEPTTLYCQAQAMKSSYCGIEAWQRYLHCAFLGLLKVSQLLLDPNQLSALLRKLLLLSHCSILSRLHTTG